MPWWIWVLLVWGILAVALGIALGTMIRTAERRELLLDRPVEERVPEEQPRAS